MDGRHAHPSAATRTKSSSPEVSMPENLAKCRPAWPSWTCAWGLVGGRGFGCTKGGWGNAQPGREARDAGQHVFDSGEHLAPASGQGSPPANVGWTHLACANHTACGRGRSVQADPSYVLRGCRWACVSAGDTSKERNVSEMYNSVRGADAPGLEGSGSRQSSRSARSRVSLSW